MKKLFLFTIVAFMILSSCSKEALDSSEIEVTTSEVTTSNASLENKAYKYVDNHETFPVKWSAWNECTGEMIYFSGTGHYRIQGTVNKNGFNFNLHYNAQNIIGVGQNSGIVYKTMDSFNYHNKGNFINGQTVWQQTGIIKYTSAGNESNLFSEDTWHLTLNANGEATRFYTTSGRIYSCG